MTIPAQAAVAQNLFALGRHLPSLAGPCAFVLVLAMVVVPLPPLALDFLFTFNISFALMILLASLYTTKATDFSAFPTLLLLTTLLRLSLNVAAARVILLDGYLGSGAAGRVIEAFGTLCRRRQLCGRYRRFRDPGHHQFRRDHQGRRAHCGSCRALRARRYAGQADGDRRRSQCRTDQPGGSDTPPPGGVAGGGFFWRDGWRQQVRARRCRRRGADPVYQSGRRVCHRHLAARPQLCRSRSDLHAANDGRRPRRADPGTGDFFSGRRDRQPGFDRARCRQPGHQASLRRSRRRGGSPPVLSDCSELFRACRICRF